MPPSFRRRDAAHAAGRPESEGRLVQLVYYAYVAGSRLALAFPEPMAYGIVHGIGAGLARISKKRQVVELNLSRVTGRRPGSSELSSLVEEAFKSYARYWLETFRLVRASKEFFIDRFVCPDADMLDRVLERGKGVVVVVGHLGNWDAAGAWAAARGHRLVTVAEVLRPKRLFDFFAAHRARLGLTILPAERGVSAKLVEAAEQGAVVAILGDRALTGRGPKVDFFGRPVTFPAGPALVALRAEVPIIVAGVFSIRMPGGRWGWEAEFSEVLELPESRGADGVQELTERIAAELERFVAKRPEEWHVFQPFWPATKPSE